MNLAQFIAGRLAKGIVVLFAIAILNFFLIRAAPGDPAQVLAGEAGAADARVQCDEQRSCDPGRDRDDSHDAQRTDEVCLESAAVTR